MACGKAPSSTRHEGSATVMRVRVGTEQLLAGRRRHSSPSSSPGASLGEQEPGFSHGPFSCRPKAAENIGCWSLLWDPAQEGAGGCERSGEITQSTREVQSLIHTHTAG